MKAALLLVVALGAGSLAACGAPAAEPPSAAAALAVSVLVDAGGGTGSGVVFKNGRDSFVWTDAHVVARTQQVKTVVDPKTGAPRVEVTYRDVEVVTEDRQDGRKVGETRRLARVVRYGRDDDLALLLVHEKGYGRASARFGAAAPQPGAAVWHVGSFHGRAGLNSVSDGVVAATGRLRRGFDHEEHDRPLVYDQVSAVAHHGSSGGGVFAKDTGECLGLVTEFVSVTPTGVFTHGAFALTPARRMREFARRTRCEWALDPAVPAPTPAAMLRGRVTDTPVAVPPDFPGARP